MKVKLLARFVTINLLLVSLLVVFIQQSAFAKPREDDGESRSHSATPGETLREGLRAEAQTERNRGNDGVANRLDNMANRLKTGNINEAEASDISREVATGNFERADDLVDRSSRN